MMRIDLRYSVTTPSGITRHASLRHAILTASAEQGSVNEHVHFDDLEALAVTAANGATSTLVYSVGGRSSWEMFRDGVRAMLDGRREPAEPWVSMDKREIATYRLTCGGRQWSFADTSHMIQNLLLLYSGSEDGFAEVEPTNETAEADIEAISHAVLSLRASGVDFARLIDKVTDAPVASSVRELIDVWGDAR